MADQLSTPEDVLASRQHALEAQLVECTQHIRALEVQRDAMLTSSSWRLTAGVRYLARLYYKIPFRPLVKISRNLIPAISVELKRHGLKGVLLRANQYRKNLGYYLRILASNTSTSKISLGPTREKRPEHLRRLHPQLVSAESKSKLDFKVSIVIPTLNASSEFRALVIKLRNQQLIDQLEIIIVDSGSTDKTIEIASEHNCKVIQIPNSEFSHSGTRNLGAAHATGDFLLFMVQDAYPIGDQWLYGMLSYLLEHTPKGVVAVSCSEYSRSDSDMMYDSMIKTHYQFLGCLNEDRIGEYIADDHMALRAQGQLSDVSCLISKSLFQNYKYRGSYAEDLDLGIRLIKDGYKVAMLASTKVIHSHNRQPYYYLKRTFVDVLFLVEIFKDFPVRTTLSLQGLLLGVLSAAQLTSDWLARTESKSVHTYLLLSEFKTRLSDSALLNEASFLEALRTGIKIDGNKLDLLLSTDIASYICFTSLEFDKFAKDEARNFVDSFCGRIEHFAEFAIPIYPRTDQVISSQLSDVIRKTLGATIGAALSFSSLDNRFSSVEDRNWIERLQTTLKSGV